VSLGTVFLGWLPVWVLFAGAAFATYRTVTARLAGATALEAFVLTLLAALWFGSLGHGGWLLVFLLLGVLVAGAERGLRFAVLRSAEGFGWGGFLLGTARYVAAGALLAWRLT
jgi:hypothetical protein